MGRGRMGSWERVREWSHDRWGEPLEVEDLLPDYLAVGKLFRCISNQVLFVSASPENVPALVRFFFSQSLPRNTRLPPVYGRRHIPSNTAFSKPRAAHPDPPLTTSASPKRERATPRRVCFPPLYRRG